MKSALVIAAALALCGSAFAASDSYHAQQHHGVMNTVRQDAHQIGSSFRHDMHRIARGDLRDQQGMEHGTRGHTTAMGAGPADNHMSSSRQSRMDAAYADWQRSHR